MTFDTYSWTVIDDIKAIKRTDLSVFKNHGSGVPVAVRPFFEIDGFVPGDFREITVVLDGEEFLAKLERTRSSARQTRLMWKRDLSDKLNSMFPDVLSTGNYPEMSIVKRDFKSFTFSFNNVYNSDILDDSREDYLENSVEKADVEGKRVQIFTTKYERSYANREAAKRIHGSTCMICGFDFEKVYGERGRGFIEVHHIKPLYSRDEEVVIDPRNDLICVCSNCHRMIHRRRDEILSPEELKSMIRFDYRN